ncbi:uncharacterized protein VP01_2683g2, partial [Puccinia sorghi]
MMIASEKKIDSDLEDYFSFCKNQYEKKYLTARGTTTIFHPKYNLSAIQSLSESCFQKRFCMSWPCFLNLLHLIKPDPIFYSQSQNKSIPSFIQNNQPVYYTSQQSNPQHEIIIGIMANTRRTSRTISGHARRSLSLYWLYGNNYYDCKNRSDTQFNSPLFVISTRNSNPIQPVIQDHATIAMYSQTCRLLSSLKNSLIKI